MAKNIGFLRVRSVEQAEYADLLAVFRDYERELGLGGEGHPNGTSAEKLLRRVRAHGPLEDAWHELCLLDGVPAGLMHYCVDHEGMVRDRPAGHGWILSFYVAAQFRRQGLGRAFARHAQENLRSCGVQKICLTPDEDARDFWRAAGFADTGFIDEDGSPVYELNL